MHANHGSKLTSFRKRLFISTGALALVLGSGAIVHAGYKVPSTSWEVSINGTSSGAFGGSVAAARMSADGMQYIGCELDWIGPTASTTATVQPVNYGYCYARDAAGNTRSCYVSIKNNTAANVLATVNQDSYIWASYFSMPDAAYCGQINVYNYSYGAVKVN